MKKIIIIGILISVALAFFLSPYASKSPDGLEKVAKDKGFLHKHKGKNIISSPIPDYNIPKIKNEKLSTSIAGLSGTLITFSFAYGIGYYLKKKSKKEKQCNIHS